MATDKEYENRISEYDWDDLLALWEAIEADNTPGWDAGKALEYLIIRAFQIEGAYVLWPYRVTEIEVTGTGTKNVVEQIDGFIHTSDGLACLVECKDEESSVNIEPIAKLRNQLLRRPSTAIGIMFSRSGFTGPALQLARFIVPQTILLWNDDEVEIALQKKWFCKGLTAKYRTCVAKGLPDYHIKRGI